jgi:hypothetical protein
MDLMIIASALRANRKWLGLGLFGLLPMFGGCDGGDQNTKPAAPATSQAQQDAERSAREKAYGKAGMPGGPPGKANAGGAAPAAEKSAPK